MDLPKRKPKVFILGISGFVGYQLALHLKKDFLVAGAYSQNRVFIPEVQIFPLDPKRQELLEPLVRVQDPDILVNCIGMNDKKQVEQNAKRADALNVVMAVSMAALAAKMRCKYIHLSCSEIYDGADGNYREEDTDYTMVHELGKQKLAAESYIRTQTLESTILRFGRILGLGHPYRPSDFDKFRAAIHGKKKVEASKKQKCSYLSTSSVCAAISAVLQAEFPGKHRIFNVGGPALSEFDLLEGWARLVEGNGGLVIPLAEDKARDISIQSDNFQRAFPTWKQETTESLYLNLLTQLSPGVGAKKWQKILQIP